MDKFTKIFEAGMQGSMENLEEGEGKKFPEFLKKVKDKAQGAKDKVVEFGGKAKEFGGKVASEAGEVARGVGGKEGFLRDKAAKGGRGKAALELLKKNPRGAGAIGAGALAVGGAGAFAASKFKKRGKKKVQESDRFDNLFDASMDSSIFDLEEALPEFLKKAKDKVVGVGQDTARAGRAIKDAPGEYKNLRNLKFKRGVAAKEALLNAAKKAPTVGKVVIGGGALALGGAGAYGAHKFKNRKRVAEAALFEANDLDKSTAKEGYALLTGRKPSAQHINKYGTHARAGAGKFAKIIHAPGMVLPLDLGSTAKSLSALDRTAKAYLGPGGSIRKGNVEGSKQVRAVAKRGAIGGVPYGALQGAIHGGMYKGRKGAILGALGGGAGGSAVGAGGHALNQKIGEMYYRRKARKVGVAEAALEEVKDRINARRIEEGAWGSITGAASSALAKLKGLKAVKQAGQLGKDIKYGAQSFGEGYKNLRGANPSAPGLFAMGRGKAAAGSAKTVGGFVGRSIKDNPYGAGLVGGGALGAGGLTAWGLKKPKKAQAEL